MLQNSFGGAPITQRGEFGFGGVKSWRIYLSGFHILWYRLGSRYGRGQRHSRFIRHRRRMFRVSLEVGINDWRTTDADWHKTLKTLIIRGYGFWPITTILMLQNLLAFFRITPFSQRKNSWNRSENNKGPHKNIPKLNSQYLSLKGIYRNNPKT